MLVGQNEYQLHLEYVAALEAARRDLMGVNEELREKIGALERGQMELQAELQQEKYEHEQSRRKVNECVSICLLEAELCNELADTRKLEGRAMSECGWRMSSATARICAHKIENRLVPRSTLPATKDLPGAEHFNGT